MAFRTNYFQLVEMPRPDSVCFPVVPVLFTFLMFKLPFHEARNIFVNAHRLTATEL